MISPTVRRHLFRDVVEELKLLRLVRLEKRYEELAVSARNLISSFDSNCTKRNENDKKNKIREKLIVATMNDKIPHSFYVQDKRWKDFKNSIDKYLEQLAGKRLENVRTEAILKGGRSNHADIIISFHNDHKKLVEYKVDFKFNALTLYDCPQWANPPLDPFMPESYAAFFYDTHLEHIAEAAQVRMPKKDKYLKGVNCDIPICKEMKFIQEEFYKGAPKSSKYLGREYKPFYDLCNQHSRASIKEFLDLYGIGINKPKLEEYIKNTDKMNISLMFYKNGVFKHEKLSDTFSNFTFNKKVSIKNSNTIVLTTKNHIKINLLLRWKNGAGIANPAFQMK